MICTHVYKALSLLGQFSSTGVRTKETSQSSASMPCWSCDSSGIDEKAIALDRNLETGCLSSEAAEALDQYGSVLGGEL